MKNGVVHLWELPNRDIYIKLDSEFRAHFFSHLNELKMSKKLRKVAIDLGFPYHAFYYMFYSDFIHLSVLMKLCKYFNELGCTLCKKDNVECHVISIKSNRRGVTIRNQEFPLDFRNKYGAIMISAFLHDGGINAKLEPHYRNNQRVLRREVCNAICNVVGQPSTNACNPSNVKLLFPKALGLILVHGVGMKRCDKISNPHIPKFVYRSNRQVRSEFIRQAIDDDGWVDKNNRSVAIELATDVGISHDSPPPLLLDDKKLIESLGIGVLGPYFKNNYMRKDGRKTSRWQIVIKGKRNFLKFSENPFKISYKRLNLENMINSFIQEQFPKNKSLEIYMKKINKLTKEGKDINRITLSRKAKRSEKMMLYVLKELTDKKLIKKKRIGIGGHNSRLTTYEITSKPGQHGVMNGVLVKK